MDNILVAIHCLAYNHEPYIRECLDGFIMQKTNFKFVAIVHEDASTDRTATIIKEYAEKYPDIIKPIYETENQYSKKDGTIQRIMSDAIEATGAKYVAMCEGDDYWIDPYKLQKQVDFMEANPEYVLCSHRFVNRIANNMEFYEDHLGNLFMSQNVGVDINNQKNLECWMTKTMTLLIRREKLFRLPSASRFKYWRDVHMNYYLLKQGLGYCFPFVGAVYRCHDNGVFFSLSDSQKWITNLRIWNELLVENKFDNDLFNFYLEQHKAFRNEIRMSIQKGRYNKILNDIKVLFILDYKFRGIKEIIFSFKKIMLSVYYRILKINN